MSFFVFNEKKLDTTSQHVIGDTQYPPHWFSDAANRSAMGIVEWVNTQSPTIDALTQRVEERPMTLVNGVWEQQWGVVALDAATIAANQANAAVQARTAAKAARTAAVEAITVTTSSGHIYNGDEVSQTRMARAIIALNAQPQSPVPTITWVLANNTAAVVTAAELTQALALSGAAQAAVWVI